MTSDVLSAIAQIIPVFLLAAVIDQAAVWRTWDATVTGGWKVLAVIGISASIVGLAAALALEVVVLFALNAGGVKGATGDVLWVATVVWLIVFLGGLISNALPRFSNPKA